MIQIVQLFWAILIYFWLIDFLRMNKQKKEEDDNVETNDLTESIEVCDFDDNMNEFLSK